MVSSKKRNSSFCAEISLTFGNGGVVKKRPLFSPLERHRTPHSPATRQSLFVTSCHPSSWTRNSKTLPPFSAGQPKSQKRLPLGPHDLEEVFKGALVLCLLYPDSTSITHLLACSLSISVYFTSSVSRALVASGIPSPRLLPSFRLLIVEVDVNARRDHFGGVVGVGFAGLTKQIMNVPRG
jgi:hypothetical protein